MQSSGDDLWCIASFQGLWSMHSMSAFKFLLTFPWKSICCLQSGISLVPEKQTPFFLKVIPYRFPYDFCPLFTELLSLIFRVSTCILQPQKVYDSPSLNQKPLLCPCMVLVMFLCHTFQLCFQPNCVGFLLLWKSFPHYISGFMREGIRSVFG